MISTLPETFLYQVNFYLRLEQSHTVKYISKYHPEFASMYLDTTKSDVKLNVLNHSNFKLDETCALDDILMSSVLRCFLTLNEEYDFALHSQHWDLLVTSNLTSSDKCGDTDIVSKKAGEFQKLAKSFLVSLVNDCHRIATTHLVEVFANGHRSFHDGSWSNDKFEKNIVDDFSLYASAYNGFIETCRYAMMHIVRILFTGLTHLLLEFDDLLLAETRLVDVSQSSEAKYPSKVCRTLMSAFRHNFIEYRQWLVPSLSWLLLLEFLKTCLKRYLLAMKLYSSCVNDNTERRLRGILLISGKEESVAQGEMTSVFRQIEVDCQSLKLFFVDMLTTCDDSALNSENLRFLTKWIKCPSSQLEIVDALSIVKFEVLELTQRVQKIAQVAYRGISYFQYLFQQNVSESPGPTVSSVTTLIRDFIQSWLGTNPASQGVERCLHEFLSVAILCTNIPRIALLQTLAFEEFTFLTMNTSNGWSDAVSTISSMSLNLQCLKTSHDLFSQLLTADDISSSLNLYQAYLKAKSMKSESSNELVELSSWIAVGHANASSSFELAQSVIRSIAKRRVDFKSIREYASDFAISVDPTHRQNMYALALFRDLGLDDSVRLKEFTQTETTKKTNEKGMTSPKACHETETSFHSLNMSNDIGNRGSRYMPRLEVNNIQVRGLQSSAYLSLANPYVSISYLNRRLKTSVKYNCTTAQWLDSVLTFPVNSNSDSEHIGEVLHVEVFDKEFIRRKRLLGSVQVRLSGVRSRPIESWFALDGGESGSSGYVFLSIKYIDET